MEEHHGPSSVDVRLDQMNLLSVRARAVSGTADRHMVGTEGDKAPAGLRSLRDSSRDIPAILEGRQDRWMREVMIPKGATCTIACFWTSKEFSKAGKRSRRMERDDRRAKGAGSEALCTRTISWVLS